MERAGCERVCKGFVELIRYVVDVKRAIGNPRKILSRYWEILVNS